MKKVVLLALCGVFILGLYFSRGVVSAQYDSYGNYITPTASEEPKNNNEPEPKKSSNNQITDLEKKIKEQEELLKKLREEAAEQEENLQKTKEQSNTLQEYIAYFNSEVYKLQTKISVKREEILSTQLAIQKVDLEIARKEQDIDKTKTQMTELFQDIYKTDQESVIELVFKYDNFSAFFNEVQARRVLQSTVDEKLQDLKRFKEELVQSKKQLDVEKERLEKDALILRDQRLIMEQKTIEQKQLLNQTKAQEETYAETLAEIKAKEREVNLEIFELEDKLRRELDPNSVPSANKGLLQWPTEGVITQGYGCIHNSWARGSYPSCDGGKGGFHNGVDIASGLGTPIRAAQDGVIKAVESSPYAYGYWVAVEHASGLVTAYTHMSSLRPVRTGQSVKQGQLVGYMDSTGYSTGPHTHFMVYAPGTFQTKPSTIAGILPIGATLNPFDYLP